jgi:hypothetical protein
VYLGQSSGGGLCAVGTSHLEVSVTMQDNSHSGVKARGNYAGVAMRADSTTNSGGYECRMSTEHGDNGISLTRDGESLSKACPRIDQTTGVYNKYTSHYDPEVEGPYDFHSLCQIQERTKSASLYAKEQTYTMRMEIEEDTEFQTATVRCFVDDELKLFFTDPCPLKGGEFALGAKYQSTFTVTDFTDTACDDVPVLAIAAPSLADGLTLNGMGNTDKYWASKNAADNAVAHRYNGGCNNGAYPYGASYHPGAAGFNREGGGRSNDVLNVASLSSGTCLNLKEHGFIEADVSFKGDYLGGANGYAKADADGKTPENQRAGVAGIAMRVDSSDDSFGYMCQMSSTNGQVSVYRGSTNGKVGDKIGSKYISGKYGCPECTCRTTATSGSGCDQFNFNDNNVLNAGDQHTLRLEVITDEDGTTIVSVECSLNGTTIVSVAENVVVGAEVTCGDFGLVTYDHDIVAWTVKDYTGYVPPPTTTSSVADEEGGACSAKCCKGTWSGTDCTPAAHGLILVQHDTTSGHAHHRCYEDASHGRLCRCQCANSADAWS